MIQDVKTTDRGAEIFMALRKIAIRNRANTQSVCTRYALERVVSRIFSSQHADEFVLKGGLIIMYAEETDPLHSRATDDIDVHLPAFEGGIERFQEILNEILAQKADDGISFDLASMKVASTREGAVPGGTVTVHADIGGMHLKIKCDVGFDKRPAHDVSVECEMPSILPDRFTPVRIRRIPLSWTVADKIQTLHRHGDATSRFKDYYDLYVILTRDMADPAQTVDAIARTYGLFEMGVPGSTSQICALSDDFAERHYLDWEKEKVARHFAVETPDLLSVVRAIRERIEPFLEQASANQAALAP